MILAISVLFLIVLGSYIIGKLCHHKNKNIGNTKKDVSLKHFDETSSFLSLKLKHIK